jgi:hypothetical protein
MDNTSRFNLKRYLPALLTVCLVPDLSSLPQRETADPFSMEEGTTSVYRGIVRWYDMQAQKTVGKTITSRSEVVRVIRRNNIIAAFIRGFPPDFDWSKGESARDDWLLVRTSTDQLYLFDSEQAQLRLKRLENPDDSLNGMLTVDDLLMSLAPRKGMKFCDAEAKARTDDYYCWLIASERELTLKDVKGWGPGKRMAFLLQFVTNPDDTEFEFVPGIGFISYRFHHHGTVVDTEMSLVEYRPSGNARSTSGVKR